MRHRHKLLLALLACAFGGASAQSTAPATAQGMITAKAFLNITGTSVANLTNNVKFPNQPDSILFLPYFEWNATGDIATAPGNFADNYGAQIVGYFYPPVTGDYIFWIASDDNSSLFLSTNSSPAGKKLIARETVWSNAREYTFSGGNSDLTAKDSSQFTASEWPVKVDGFARITLQGGQPYYIEALAKEGTGGDFLSVAVQAPNGEIDPFSPIPGQYLSSDRSLGAASIQTQPQSQTIPERGSVTFSVLPNGTPPYTYQWQKNGTPISDATNLNLTLGSVAVADNNNRYSVVVTGAQGNATSQDAVLTVSPDTNQPTVLNAKASPNRTEVVITFSEAVDAATASALTNYAIASASGPLAISAAARSDNGTQVTLTTAQQSMGTKYTLLVSNLKDTAATPNTLAPNSKVVFFPTGKVIEQNGFIIFEAENYDRNLDGLWVRDTTRGIPSGGASVVNPNGAGGSESATKLEYDVEFKQAGTYVVWFRASGDNGNDDSAWFHLNGERPIERVDGNQASMTGFQPQSDFVWRSDSQDGPDPFTVDIAAPGTYAIGLARREDGSFFDKFLLTMDTAYTPTGFGPPETREGAPGLPNVTLTAPTSGQTFTVGGNIPLTVNAAGQSGLDITRVEYTANGNLIGTATAAPFNFTWTNIPAGVFGVRATAYDELGQAATSDSAAVTVGTPTRTSARIAWVSFHRSDTNASANATTAGFVKPPDIAYTDLLKAAGHEVTRFLTTGAPDTNVLNAYDLVIVSRSVPSGDYQDPPETLAWNSVTAPSMLLGGYALRQNRLGFFTGSTIPDTTGDVTISITDTNHAIFKGVTLGANNTLAYSTNVSVPWLTPAEQRGISVVTDPVAGNGTVLATADVGGVPGTIIAEWKKGDTLADANARVLGGDRMVFLTGSREANGLNAELAGVYDLTPQARKLFLNAVNYMAGVEPGTETPTISIGRTGGVITINFTGTLQSTTTIGGNWADETGANSPLTVTPSSPVKFYRSRR